MEDLTGFWRKISVTLLSLANTFFNSLRDENIEVINTYNEEYNVLKKVLKVVNVECFNQSYKSCFSDKVVNIIPQELNVQGNKIEIIEKHIEFTIKSKKTFESEFHSQTENYQDNIQEENVNLLTVNLVICQFTRK